MGCLAITSIHQTLTHGRVVGNCWTSLIDVIVSANSTDTFGVNEDVIQQIQFVGSGRTAMRDVSDHQSAACMEMDINALRLLHRVVSDAYLNWSGGLPEEQLCLSMMRTQLYAALMDHLLEDEQI